MRAAPSYCQAGHREGDRGSASRAAGLGKTLSLQLGVLLQRPGRARKVQQANFYTETRTKKPRCDFETERRARVLVLEDDEGGGACAPEPAPRRERLVHRPVSQVASPEPSRDSAPAPPAEPSLKANESAAAGCAATTFPVFFLNSAGGGRSAAPSPWLSGNTPPHAPLGPRPAGPGTTPLQEDSELPKPARAPRRVLPRSLGPGRPAAPPPRRGITPHSRGAARFEAKPERRRAGASECDCGAVVGLGEGSGGKPGVERPPPPPPALRVAPAAGLRQHLARTRARGRAPARGTPSAPRSRRAYCLLGGSGSPPPARCSLEVFAGEPDGLHKQGYLGPAQPFLRVGVLGF